MKNFLGNKKQQWLLLLVVSLIAVIFMEIVGFMMSASVASSEPPVSLMASQAVQVESAGYDVSGVRYTQIKDDPRLLITGIDQTVRYVTVWFKYPILERTKIQVYYRKAENPYCEADATSIKHMPIGTTWYTMEIPEGQYETLRLDIDGDFILRDVMAGMEPITVERHFTDSFSIVRVLAMLTACLAVGSIFLWWLHRPRTALKLNGFELALCCACFVFYTLWAIQKPITFSPDEQMRFEVTQFMFEHNRLPKNDELISMPWGFTYAHFPIVLCNQLGYVFMKAASLFVSGEFKLLVAARMVSVCAGTGTVYIATKISKCVFRTPARYVMIAFVAFMPQFAFLSSYVNNDSLALLGVSMILFSWILAYEFKWNWKSALLLAVGVSTCGLAYYNSYPWILMSIIFFVVSYYYQNRKDHKGFAKMLSFIVVVVLLLIGYNFIRHLVLYGELFGFNIRRYYGEIYGVQHLKPSITMSPAERDVWFWDMLFTHPYEYVRKVFQSFVGVFGYMSVYAPDGMYKIVYAMFYIAVIGLVWKLIANIVQKKHAQPMKVFWIVCAVAASCICVGMTVYKCYTGDFQPQGRYHYPSFMFFALMFAKGYEQLLRLIKQREHQYAITAVICTVFAAISWYAYSCVFLPG